MKCQGPETLDTQRTLFIRPVTTQKISEVVKKEEKNMRFSHGSKIGEPSSSLHDIVTSDRLCGRALVVSLHRTMGQARMGIDTRDLLCIRKKFCTRAGEGSKAGRSINAVTLLRIGGPRRSTNDLISALHEKTEDTVFGILGAKGFKGLIMSSIGSTHLLRHTDRRSR